MISIQLFDRFTEQRRLNLRRLIRLGFAGRSSQINGILLRQSNIFQDFSDVNATQPRRVPSLKFIILFVSYLELMKKSQSLITVDNLVPKLGIDSILLEYQQNR